MSFRNLLDYMSKRFRVTDIFHKKSGDKSSQTVQWQNQMFDYRAHYESQPSVSVDFLRVVQFHVLAHLANDKVVYKFLS